MTTARFVLAVGLAALAGVLAACAPAGAGAPSGVPSPTATATHGEWPPGGDVAQPPPFEVRYDREALLLHPFTFCHEGGCVDGVDEDPPSVGPATVLFVHVPVPELDELTVTEAPESPEASGVPGVEATTEHLGHGWWRVDLTGPDGEHRLSLFAGSDAGAGDMVAEVRWTGGPWVR